MVKNPKCNGAVSNSKTKIRLYLMLSFSYSIRGQETEAKPRNRFRTVGVNYISDIFSVRLSH